MWIISNYDLFLEKNSSLRFNLTMITQKNSTLYEKHMIK
jgi:hypothetical protein